MLGKAGFDTKWLHCLPNAAVETGPCAQSGLSTFSIGIRKDDLSEKVTHFTLGFAMLNTARANTACAIYSRITELVEQNPGSASVETVLGYVIAHELAHLIQRSNLHSTGVMSERWTVSLLRAMSQRGLRFTTSQTRDLWKAMEARQN